MPRSNLRLILCALALNLAACTDRLEPSSDTGSNHPARADKATPAAPAATGGFGTPLEVLAAFRKDLATCRQIVKYRLPKPRERAVDLQDPERILDVAPYAGTPEAAYFKANRDYVYLLETYHHDPFSVARFDEFEPLFCGVSTKRLEDIDKSQTPEVGWEIREYFLNLGVDNLATVLHEGPGGDAVRWEWLRDHFKLAEKFYAKTQREKLLSLSRKLATRIQTDSVNDYKTYQELYKGELNSSEALKAKSDLDKETASRAAFIRDMINRLQVASN